MKLARREKYLVSAGVGFVLIFLLFQFVIFPFFESRRRMKSGLKAKETGLDEIMKLSAEYQTYQKSSQGIQQALARRAEVKTHIKYMKPSRSSGTGPYKESTVEMKLEAVTLEQLAGYLYRIESPVNLVNIKRISINENKKEKGYLDAVMQVLTFQ
jgi:general secretion pathway protein M